MDFQSKEERQLGRQQVGIERTEDIWKRPVFSKDVKRLVNDNDGNDDDDDQKNMLIDR